jgi:hypothetical protein
MDWTDGCPFEEAGKRCGMLIEYVISAPGTLPDTASCGDAEHLLQTIEARLHTSASDYVRVYRAAGA